MKKKFKFGPAVSKTSQAANQVKRTREREDAQAVRAGNPTPEQSIRFGVTRALHQRVTDCSTLGWALAIEDQSVNTSWGENFDDMNEFTETFDARADMIDLRINPTLLRAKSTFCVQFSSIIQTLPILLRKVYRSSSMLRKLCGVSV